MNVKITTLLILVVVLGSAQSKRAAPKETPTGHKPVEIEKIYDGTRDVTVTGATADLETSEHQLSNWNRLSKKAASKETPTGHKPVEIEKVYNGTRDVTVTGATADFGTSSTSEWEWLDNHSSFPPTEEWKTQCKTKFENLGVYTNFSKNVGHPLHMVSKEEFEMFFDVDLPEMNGIPTMNFDLEASDSEIVLENLPSRPSDFKTPGIYGFDKVMTNFDKPWGIRGNTLEKLLHTLHVYDLLRRAKDKLHMFDEVSDDICACALDVDGNGIKGDIKNKHHFIAHRSNSPEYNAKYGIPQITDAESYTFWKNIILNNIRPWYLGELTLEHAALYFNCAIKKYKNLNKK